MKMTDYLILVITFLLFSQCEMTARAADCAPMYLKHHTFQANGYYEENGVAKFYWGAKDYDGDGQMDAYFEIYKLVTLTRADLCIKPLTADKLLKVLK
jgi:hypothetical protein